MTEFLVILFALLGATVYAEDCRHGWTLFQHDCFAYVDHKMNWPDAATTCAALGGFLAEIFSAEQNKFILELGRPESYHSIWIGGNDLLIEGHWDWVTSGHSIKNFTDWGPGQPENDPHDDENCLEINYHIDHGKWNDDQCSHENRFVCQRPLVPNAIFG